MNATRVSPKLVVLNAGLAALVLGTLVLAQPAATPRPRGEYTMVSGKSVAGSKDIIYIVDVTSREMIALRWENSRKSLVGVGYRSLDVDSALPPAR